MKAKKALIVAGIITVLGFTALQQASARGWGGGPGGGPCYYGNSMNYQQMDPANQEKFTAFRADTVELRKQMAMKRAEKRALMAAQDPNPAAVAKVEGELFDLRTEMQGKAAAAGLPAMGGSRGMWGGGMGMGGPDRGSRPCLNQPGWN